MKKKKEQTERKISRQLSEKGKYIIVKIEGRRYFEKI